MLNFKECFFTKHSLIRLLSMDMFRIKKIKYYLEGGSISGDGEGKGNGDIFGGLTQSAGWTTGVSALGVAGTNLAQNLSNANTVNSSSNQSANLRYGVAKGLISSGNPYAMAAGAALGALQASGGFGDNTMTSDNNLAEAMGLGKSFDTKTKIMSWALPGTGWGAGKTQDYKSSDELKQMSSAYAGTASSALTAEKNANAKILGKRNRKKVNNYINEVSRQDNLVQDIYNNAKDTQNATASMSSIAASNVQTILTGGLNLTLARAARLGGILEAKRKCKELSRSFWEAKALKEGGKIDQEAQVKSLVKDFWSNPDRLKILQEPQKFQDGGKMNVIPEGNLHARRHHMENDEHITKKGIPVIDSEGHQQAEIEVNELILTYEVTKTIETWWNEWRITEDPKRKNELAIICGKYLVDQIINNTDDRTGLIRKTKI